MADADIAALPILERAKPDALLFLWVTVPMQWRVMTRVLPAWRGFEYKSEIVWVKDRQATGYYSFGKHELCWILRRGKFAIPRPAPLGTSVIAAPRREHSRKPDELQDRIDRAWPDARKLELFARQRRPGWDAWGNETDKFEATP